MKKISQEKNLDKKDWILLLLYSKGSQSINEPIMGRIKLMKELFVISQIIKPSNFYSFVPYLYGPCSFEVYEDLEILVRNGLVEVINEYKSGHGTYSLTEKGVEEAKKLFSDIDENKKKKIEEIKKELNNLSFIELLKKIYTQYPDYAKNSMVAIPKQL